MIENDILSYEIRNRPSVNETLQMFVECCNDEPRDHIDNF